MIYALTHMPSGISLNYTFKKPNNDYPYIIVKGGCFDYTIQGITSITKDTITTRETIDWDEITYEAKNVIKYKKVYPLNIQWQ